MLVSAKCKKCMNDFKLDIGESTKEVVIATLASLSSFHCNAGNHMELASPLNFWDIDWETLEVGNSETEDQFIERIRAKYPLVIPDILFSQVAENVSFAYGACLFSIKGDPNEVPIMADFTVSPDGMRYYFSDSVNEDIMTHYRNAMDYAIQERMKRDAAKEDS